MILGEVRNWENCKFRKKEIWNNLNLEKRKFVKREI